MNHHTTSETLRRDVSRLMSGLRRLAAATAASRRAVLALALLGTAACSDSITAPILTDPGVDQQIMPSVQDARLRLVPVIENQGVRDRVAYDLAQLELAISRRDAVKARYHVRLAGNLLLDYRNGLRGVVKDGPDVGAIALALYTAAIAVGTTFDIASFH